MAFNLRDLTPLFAELDPAVLEELEQAATEVRFAIGDTVFRSGDPGDALYIVLSGLLEVVAETANRERCRLETVTHGEWFGELSLLNDRPRAASVFALENSTVIRLPVNVCRRLLGALPDAKQRFIDAASSRLPSRQLHASPLFAGLNAEALQALDEHLQWVRLPSGEILCREKDPADAVFIVVAGSMEVLVGFGDAERLVDVLERGASVGEMAVLAGETRSATVRAIRDSDLIRIPRAAFLQLLGEHAQVAVNLARILAVRLRQTTSAPQRTRGLRAVAIISGTDAPISERFVEQLASALEPLKGRVQNIGSREVDAALGAGAAGVGFGDDARGRLSNWLDAQEEGAGAIIYRCDGPESAWTLRALRQSDLVLVVADGKEAPTATSAFDWAISQGAVFSRVRPELVLVHQDNTRPTQTERWLEAHSFARHHHLRADRASDFGRLARSISGASVGVALSGGGARGFAHYGLLKALEERGIPVDSIGGTSMGSVIAAQVALGWDLDTMIARSGKAFVECPVVSDLTFPYVAIMRGASATRLIQEMFGDVQVEDLWLPYFCVSTNLSRAELVVHDRGPLWLWIRASSAVPGIGPPVPWKGDLLVDGGLLNNLPVEILRRRCPGRAIASDASPTVDLTTREETCAAMSGWPHLWRKLNPWSEAQAFPNLFEIMMRIVGMSSDQALEQTKKGADLYLHPPLASVSALDWGAIERVVEIGYRHACEQLDQWDYATTANKRVIHA